MPDDVAQPRHTLQLRRALQEARLAAQKAEVPVGATLFDSNGTLIAAAHNQTETLADPTAHAEMLVLRQAIQGGRKYLEDCTLAVTLEPCAMCLGALCAARVGTIVFGAYDPKSGGTVNGARVAQHAHFKPEILGGIEEAACAALLTQFFSTLR